MATWSQSNTVLTTKGMELLAKVCTGIGSITISRIVTGGTTVADGNLTSLLAIPNIKQTFEVVKSGLDGTKGSFLEVQLTNELLASAYNLCLIGIYVTHPDYVGEVLYYVAKDSAPDLIPLFADTPISLHYSLYMKHSGTSNVTMEFNYSGLVTYDEFHLHEERKIFSTNGVHGMRFTPSQIVDEDGLLEYIDELGQWQIIKTGGNADKLGNQLPSYYASVSSVSDIILNVPLANWVLASGIYSQTLTVSGVLPTTVPLYDIYTLSKEPTASEKTAFSNLLLETVTNGVKLTTPVIPTVTFNIIVKGLFSGNVGGSANETKYKYNVKNYGAKGDGIANDTAIIQGVIEQAEKGEIVYFPKGTYLVDTLILKDGTCILGEDKESTFIEALVSSNKNVVTCSYYQDWVSKASYDSFMLTHTVDDLILGGSIKSISIDGKSYEGKSLGSCIALVGNNIRIEDCHIFRAPEHNLIIRGIEELTDYAEASGKESVIRDVKLDSAGKHGLFFNGASGSVIDNLVVIDSSQVANNTYSQIYITEGVSAKFVNCHTRHRSLVTNISKYGMECLGLDCDFVNCHFEGSRGGVRVYGNHNNLLNVNCYSVYANGGINVLLEGNNNVMKNLKVDVPKSGVTSCTGVKLGANASANVLEVYCVGQTTSLDVSASLGTSFNSIEINGAQDSGNAVVGTPNAITDLIVNLKFPSSRTIVQSGPLIADLIAKAKA